MIRIFSTLLISVLLFYGCKNDRQSEEHEHGLEALVYTLYTEKAELFVEFKPLTLGSVSKFATHITVLGDKFSALEEGEVTVSLIVDGKGIKQKAESPSSPGIFRLELKPTVAGSAKLQFDIKTKDFTDQFIIDDLKVYKDESSAMADQKEIKSNGEISFLKEQAWGIDFSTTLIIETDFHDVIKTSGQILSAVGDEIIVTSGARGIVQFAGANILEGAEIKADQKMFSIGGGQLSESNVDISYKEAKANYDRTKKDYERMSELVKDKIVSEKAYQQSKAEWEKAEARFMVMMKNHSAQGQTISSPLTGYIKNVFVNEGEFVEAGTPLTTISKNEKLLLQANVSQKYFDKLKDVRSANFKPVNSSKIYRIKDLNGRLLSYGKSSSGDNPFIPLTFEFSNTSDILAGSLAEVFLQSTMIKNALVVPVKSLIEEQGLFYVFVQTGGESFAKREVKLGAEDGLHVQVISGIKTGERVVDKGAYQIKLSAASGAMPDHGHEH